MGWNFLALGAGAATSAQEPLSGGQPEIVPERLESVIFYSRTLAVPGRRDLSR
jgi:CxxC motif-containing protein (DUF1111 family)